MAIIATEIIFFVFTFLLDHLFQHLLAMVVEGVVGLRLYTEVLRSEMLEKIIEMEKLVALTDYPPLPFLTTSVYSSGP